MRSLRDRVCSGCRILAMTDCPDCAEARRRFDDSEPQCTAITAGGTQCQRKATHLRYIYDDWGDQCAQHAEIIVARERETARLRDMDERYPRCDYAYPSGGHCVLRIADGHTH